LITKSKVNWIGSAIKNLKKSYHTYTLYIKFFEDWRNEQKRKEKEEWNVFW
jgi:hypothetical protein